MTMTPDEYRARKEAQRERLLERAERMEARANATATQARRMAEAIPFGQPMLTDHYSYRRDRNYRDRIHRMFGRAVEEGRIAENLARRAARESAGISSDDPTAVDQIRERIAELEARQERMKQANKIIGRFIKGRRIPRDLTSEQEVFMASNQVAARDALTAAGWSISAAWALVQPNCFQGVGHESFELSNNSANIRRLRERIVGLERRDTLVEQLAETGTDSGKGDGVEWWVDDHENRVCIKHDQKPPREVTSQLRRMGFVWSPRNGRWQRQLSPGAIRLARDFVEATVSA